MNLAGARVVLRPRGAGEIIDLSAQIVGKHALPLYAWLSLFVVVPLYAGCMVLRYVLDVSWWLVWPAAWFLSYLAGGVFTIAAGKWMFAERLRVRDVLGDFLRRSPSFVTGAIFRTVLTVLALAGFAITSPIVATLLLYVPEATLLEMAGPAKALGRSNDFSRHSRGRAFVNWVALFGLHFAVAILCRFLCAGLVEDVLQVGSPFPPAYEVGGDPYLLFGVLIAAPYIATARFLMYIDGRTRSDGWDIQVRFLGLAAEREARSQAAIEPRADAARRVA